MWVDQQFWAQLAKADRSLFRAVAYRFMQVAAQLVRHLRGKRFDVSRLVSDVEAVRAIMVQTWAEHAQELRAPAEAGAAHAFSHVGAEDARQALDNAKDATEQFRQAELQYGGRAAYEAQKAPGATLLTYPQWIITKTPNFKQFYGDWVAGHDNAADNRSIHPGLPAGKDAGGLHGGAGAAAERAPTFPGQSGPVRALGRAPTDAAREPAVYFHGTRDDVDAFNLNHPGRKDQGWLGTGVYATSSDWLAESYASLKQGVQGPNVLPLFTAVRKPFVATPELKRRLSRASREQINAFTADLAAEGFDGVVLNFPDGTQELGAFDPGAVKSALGNNGGFDRGNPHIAFSRATTVPARANVLIASPIGVLASHPDYAAAKAGDAQAALRAVQDTLPPAFIDQVRAQFGGRDVIVQPVLSIEQTGRNKLPLAGAHVLAHGAGLRVSEHVVQSTRPQRTTLGGLERIFSRPQFVGEVQAGASYLLLDDTLTQGGPY
ncbi:MAG: hypothetical protein K2X55_30375 [Burkholderiaceae bacterium]|nr:hypothetical protein [Burkholderiaceae bacterium]